MTISDNGKHAKKGDGTQCRGDSEPRYNVREFLRPR